jgi:hypothetical protein
MTVSAFSVDEETVAADMCEGLQRAIETGDEGAWGEVVLRYFDGGAKVPPYVADISIRFLVAAFSRIRALERRLKQVECRGISFHGAWEAGKTYRRGEVVVRRGSSFVALRDATDDPGVALQNPPTWALLAQRGKDGKDLR